MTRLPVRLSLLILCLAAISGAGFLLWSSARVDARGGATLRQFALHARGARSAIGELRAAQQAYVAVGQGEDFWFARVSELGKEIEERIGSLRSLAQASGTASDLEAAMTAVQEFMQMDLRARDYVRGRQMTLASDMVFADGFELIRKAADALDRALTGEEVARDAAAAAAQRRQAGVIGAAAAIVLIGMVLLLPTGRKRLEREGISVAPAAAVPAVSDQTLDDLSDFGLVARPLPPLERRINLDAIASLCRDLARVPDTRALPSLLERTAAVIDASGLVLWIADPDGRELSPILVHGYPPQLANRLGTIPREAENVTAAAYRTGLLQTVKGDAISSGAIAAPLVGAAGCVGVMAAEMKNGGEQHEPLLAAATIIAAQLATLVGPPSARAKTEAAG